jgi:hypothetical protein
LAAWPENAREKPPTTLDATRQRVAEARDDQAADGGMTGQPMAG